MLAVDFDVTDRGADQVLTFHTKTGGAVAAGPDHAIRVDRRAGDEPAPYVHVRNGLWALIDRKSFYRMVDLGTHADVAGTGWFGIRSGGAFFAMIPSADLP